MSGAENDRSISARVKREWRITRETIHMTRYLERHDWKQDKRPPWLWRHPTHPASPCDFERAFLAANKGEWSPQYFDRKAREEQA